VPTRKNQKVRTRGKGKGQIAKGRSQRSDVGGQKIRRSEDEGNLAMVASRAGMIRKIHRPARGRCSHGVNRVQRVRIANPWLTSRDLRVTCNLRAARNRVNF
jgi:hypothetical protein